MAQSFRPLAVQAAKSSSPLIRTVSPYRLQLHKPGLSTFSCQRQVVGFRDYLEDHSVTFVVGWVQVVVKFGTLDQVLPVEWFSWRTDVDSISLDLDLDHMLRGRSLGAESKSGLLEQGKSYTCRRIIARRARQRGALVACRASCKKSRVDVRPDMALLNNMAFCDRVRREMVSFPLFPSIRSESGTSVETPQHCGPRVEYWLQHEGLDD